MAIFGFDLENEISVCVRNEELKTPILLSKKAIINWEKSSKPGFDCWALQKSKANNQQLLRNKLKLKLKYDGNLRFKNQIW